MPKQLNPEELRQYADGELPEDLLAEYPTGVPITTFDKFTPVSEIGRTASRIQSEPVRVFPLLRNLFVIFLSLAIISFIASLNFEGSETFLGIFIVAGGSIGTFWLIVMVILNSANVKFRPEE